MKLFVNHNKTIVRLTDAHGKVISIRPSQKILLTDYFDRYVQSGHLSHAVASVPSAKAPHNKSKATLSNSLMERRARRDKTTIELNNPTPNTNSRKDIKKAEIIRPLIRSAPTHNAISQPRQRKIGRPIKPTTGNKFRGKSIDNPRDKAIYDQSAESVNHINISNGIGIGILSYNRPDSLKRLINSITKHTDLSKTTIFISDDGSKNQEVIDYLVKLSKSLRFCVLNNNENIGIAGNSNRLLQCLKRFRYGIIMNDDVEIMGDGWEYFYPDAMKTTGLKHFIYREDGIYGCTIGSDYSFNGRTLLKSDCNPQGAILAFDTTVLDRIGYFNEDYGKYGMEHVDWSSKFFELKVNSIDGFFDVSGSGRYFKLHNERSAVEDRMNKLSEARELHKRRKATVRHDYTTRSAVPALSVVIPYRDQDRSNSIITVIECMMGQLFPNVNIILSEHSRNPVINPADIIPSKYYHVAAEPDEPFNKSKAFNYGVDKADDGILVLHDADMVVPNYYLLEVFKALSVNESCHIGKDVSYYNQSDTSRINREKRLFKPESFERYVAYYEGGSLACTKSYYSKIGGFLELYSGYGCEDCDFYHRLSTGGSFLNDRTMPLYHLWHPRSDKWQAYHEKNAALEKSLKLLADDVRIADAKNHLMRKGYKTI